MRSWMRDALIFLAVASCLSVGFLLAAVPQWLDHRRGEQNGACGLNLNHLAEACDLYRLDHHGRYPATLTELSPVYLKTLPTCPSAGTNTYNYSRTARGFSIFCQGNNHGGKDLPSLQTP